MSGSGRSRALIPIDVGRGFLMGSAELVPGVSGGTVALVTGIYEKLVDAAGNAIAALRSLVTGPDRVDSARAELGKSDLWLIGPVLLGMVVAVVTVAGLMGDFVSDSPELARGLFLGLVAASIAVPLRMMPSRDRHWLVDVGIAGAAAVLAWLLVGLASGAGEGGGGGPALWQVAGAAAIAVCALALPGVSGSFLLLAMGLYGPTLAAIDKVDVGYLAVFAGGAVVGLGIFVPVLRKALDSFRRTTLLVMAGLMTGSLRALWPWQDVDGEGVGPLLAPQEPIWGPVALAVLGAAVVVVLVVIEARRSSSAD